MVRCKLGGHIKDTVEVPAVSKRGVDDGNQKVGAFPSRHKKAINIISYLHKIKCFACRSEIR
jgi:hypothetical protein